MMWLDLFVIDLLKYSFDTKAILLCCEFNRYISDKANLLSI